MIIESITVHNAQALLEAVRRLIQVSDPREVYVVGRNNEPVVLQLHERKLSDDSLVYDIVINTAEWEPDKKEDIVPDPLTVCRQMTKRWGMKPFNVEKFCGIAVEFVSYPYPEVRGGSQRYFVKARTIPGDPTSMVELEVKP
jgi:hypothetical protein